MVKFAGTLSDLRKKFINELVIEKCNGYDLDCYFELGFEYFEPHDAEDSSADLFKNDQICLLERPFSHKNPEINQIFLYADWIKSNMPETATLFLGGDSGACFKEHPK